MKTVRYSLNELIAESDSEYIYNLVDKRRVHVSKRRIVKNIHNSIGNFRYRVKIRYRVALIAAAVLLMSSFTVYASVNHIFYAEKIDESNKHLVGSEATGPHILYDNGVYYNENNEVIDINAALQSSSVIPDNRIVESIDIPDFYPPAIVEFLTQNENNGYASPDIIMHNAVVCVLTQGDGNARGWNLEKGDKLTYSFEKYDSEVLSYQTLGIGYIKDGVMYPWDYYKEQSGIYTQEIKEAGEYYIYLINLSSDYLSIKEGMISIK